MVVFIQELSLRIITLLFFLFSGILWARMVDGVAILVKEEPITLYAIEQKMEEEHLPQQEAVDALIREKLESQEIRQRGLSVSEEELRQRLTQIAEQNNLTLLQLYDAVRSAQHLSESAFKAKLRETMVTQKLYGDIAMATMAEPNEEEMREYYRLHAEKFSHPETFNVTLYRAPSQGVLQRKMANPMLNLPEVQTQEVQLPYAQIEPGLAALLLKTENGAFTPVLPDPKGGFVTFFVRNRSLPMMQPFEAAKPQVQEELMADKREQTLKDYFDRARLNAEITILRLPD